MSKEFKHIIQRQIFQLHLDKEEYHHELSEGIKGVFNAQVIPRLSKVFDQISKGRTIRINKLEVELPSMKLEDWKNEFPALLVQRIKEEVEIQLSEIIEKENKSEQIIKQFIAGNEEVATTSIIEAFLFFCKKGYFPWWIQVEDFNDFENKILKVESNILEKNITRIVSEPEQLERLVKQFSNDFFVAYFNKQQKGETLKLDVIFWKEILTKIKTNHLGKEKINEIVLKSILFTQFISSITSRNKKSIEKILVEKIIQFIQIETKQNKTDIALEIFNIVKTNEKYKSINIKKGLEEFIQKESGIINLDNDSTNLFNQQSTEDSFITPFSELGDKETEKSRRDEDFSEDAQYIRNAGIVIVWPFLTRFFESLDLTNGKSFKSEKCQIKAILILQYLVDGKTHWNEHELFMNKIICGFPLWKTIPTDLKLTAEIEKEAEALYSSIIEYWDKLKNTSTAGLQSGFIQREGKLEMKDENWILTVNRETLDILLDHIPWSFRTVKLPWMKNIIRVHW